MYLEWASGGTDDDPTEDKIDDLILSEQFVILSAAPDTYIQTWKDSEKPMRRILEYQDGSLDDHFRAADKSLPFARVSSAMAKYLRGDPSWRTDFRWKRIKITPGSCGETPPPESA